MSPRATIESPAGPPTPDYLSAAVRAGDLIFVSGNAGFISNHDAGDNPTATPGELVSGDIREQTRQTIRNIQHALRDAGASLDDVVKVNTFLRDPDRDFWAYTEAYREFFGSNPPARTSVGATIYGGILVEIECVAYAPLTTTGSE